MYQVAKVCVTGLAGLGMCTTAPAWVVAGVSLAVVAGAVAVAKSQ